MAKNFYLLNEGDAVAKSAAFAQQLVESPGAFGITPEQAAQFGEVNDRLRAAWLAAKDPATRTRPAVAEKNSALDAMRQQAILLAKIITATPTVEDSQLVSLGLLPRLSRQKVAAPQDAPQLRVLSVTGSRVNLLITENNRRGIAAGTRGANVYSFVGAEPPADPADFDHRGLTTRAKMTLPFPSSVPPGSLVWLSAHWVGTRGQTGPACSPVRTYLQGGDVQWGAGGATRAG